jgi:hypothetical protein
MLIEICFCSPRAAGMTKPRRESGRRHLWRGAWRAAGRGAAGEAREAATRCSDGLAGCLLSARGDAFPAFASGNSRWLRPAGSADGEWQPRAPPQP